MGNHSFGRRRQLELISMLWGDQAIELSQTANHVVFIQRARLSSYHGVIGLASTTTAEFNINIDHPRPRHAELTSWWAERSEATP